MPCRGERGREKEGGREGEGGKEGGREKEGGKEGGREKEGGKEGGWIERRKRRKSYLQ